MRTVKRAFLSFNEVTRHIHWYKTCLERVLVEDRGEYVAIYRPNSGWILCEKYNETYGGCRFTLHYLPGEFVMEDWYAGWDCSPNDPRSNFKRPEWCFIYGVFPTNINERRKDLPLP